jgi:hypothetical protein
MVSVDVDGRREHPLFLVQCCGARRHPNGRLRTRKILEDANDIDQQSWPMFGTVSRD